jgi:hypothetical protein
LGHKPLIVASAKDACSKLNKYYTDSDALVYVIGTSKKEYLVHVD